MKRIKRPRTDHRSDRSVLERGRNNGSNAVTVFFFVFFLTVRETFFVLDNACEFVNYFVVGGYLGCRHVWSVHDERAFKS